MRSLKTHLLEKDDMKIVCQWLNMRGIPWKRCHDKEPRRAMASSGGFPDLLICKPTSKAPHGCAINLGAIGCGVAIEQITWLSRLSVIGMVTNVCYGHKDTISFLADMGY